MPGKSKKVISKKEIPPHYVCVAWCGFETDKPERCTTIGCRRGRNPLTLCNCKDGKHTKLHKLYKTI